MIPFLLINLVKIAFVIWVMLTIVAYTVFAERKVCAWMQDRIGPNRVGPMGLMQPLADGLKFVFKEDVLSHHVNKVYFTLAPMISLVPALITIAVVPWGSQPIIPDTGGAGQGCDRGPKCRHPFRVRHFFAGCLRHCARGLGEQFEISVFGRHSLQRTDDFLRSLPRIKRGADIHAGWLPQFVASGRIPGPRLVVGILPAALLLPFSS